MCSAAGSMNHSSRLFTQNF